MSEEALCSSRCRGVHSPTPGTVLQRILRLLTTEREIGFKIKLTEETGLVLAWSPGPTSLTSSGDRWRRAGQPLHRHLFCEWELVAGETGLQ